MWEFGALFWEFKTGMLATGHQQLLWKDATELERTYYDQARQYLLGHFHKDTQETGIKIHEDTTSILLALTTGSPPTPFQ